MRLPPKLVEVMAFRITRLLVDHGYIENVDPNTLEEKIEHAILEELSLEDKLDEEVRKILSQYDDAIQRSDVEYHELFRKVKQRLAKEKGIVL